MRALVILLAAAVLAGSETAAPAQSSAGLPPELGVVQYPGPAGAEGSSTSGGAASTAPRKSIANPYLNKPNPYAASAVAPRGDHSTTDPRETAAARQSGFSNTQARNIIEQQGYTRIGEVRAEPNSIWVWQADAMKDGRPVRIGIDYRGKLLELGGAARPCAAPQTGLGPVSPLGAGVRLYESSGCSAH